MRPAMPRMVTARQPSFWVMTRAASITMAANCSREWSERRAMGLPKKILNHVQYPATYLNVVQLCPQEVPMSSSLAFSNPGAFAKAIQAKGQALLAGQSRFADPL